MNGNGVRPPAIRLGAAALLAALLLAGCWNQTASESVEAGKARMQKAEYRAAVVEFKNALQKDGSLVEARFWLGKALLESGDVQGAWVELSKAREGGYNSDELVPVMAAALILRGDINRFIGEYADVQLVDPKRQSELKAALATAYSSRGEFVQARAEADAALRADPGNIVAQLAIARLLLVAGDRSAALEQIERTMKAYPQSERPWVSKAELLQHGGAGSGEVVAAYREALKRDRNSIAAHTGIVSLLMQQRDFDGVRKQLDDLELQSPGNLQGRYFGALLALEKKDLKTAYEAAQQLLKAVPGNPRFLHLAGAIDYERGAYSQALVHLAKALPDSPAPVGVRVLMARAQLRLGDPRKALSFVQPLMDGEAALPGEVYSVAADAYLQMDSGAAAKKMLAKAVEVNPGDSRGRTALALAELGEGRTERAMAELKAISAGDGGGAQADVVMAIAHLRGNRLDEALAAADALELKQPGSAAAPYLRALVEARRGRADKARAQFETALGRQPSYLPAAAALAAMDQKDGRQQAAVARYESLVAADPQSVSAVMALISMRATAGVRFEDLKSQLEQAVQRFPDADAPRVALASALIERGETQAALRVANEAAARFPGNPRLQESLGLAELAAGNLNQAAQAFAKMATLSPNAVEPLVHQAEVHLARKDVPAAVAQLRKAVGMKPDFVPAQASLIKLLARSGKVDEALAQARSVQTLMPGEPHGWTFEGDVQMARGNKAAAVAALRTSFARRATAETAMKLHRTLVAANQSAEADRLESDWLARQPDDAAFHFYLGDQAMRRQDYGRAEQAYRKAIAAQPQHAAALNNLAWLLHRAGKPGALETAEKALALAPNAPAFMDTVAEIQASSGQWDKALAMQKRAVELDPDQPAHRLHLAQYLIKNNQKAAARAELEGLARLGGAFARQDEVRKLMSSL